MQTPPEITLDPSDWDDFRSLAHQMVDDMLSHMKDLRSEPAWQPIPRPVREALEEELPRSGSGPRAAYRDFQELVLPYTNGNRHPRFWGWVQGNGTPLGMMADMLAAGLNPHMAGFDQAPVLVEERVLQWLAELMGFPTSASGVLTGSGTMANVLGLAVARHAGAGFDVEEEGLQGQRQRLVAYASSETHGWVKKGMALLGLGTSSLRQIPVTDAYRMDVEILRQEIATDRRRGWRPFSVIANAGTVNTGATDDLPAIAALCKSEGLWFHVDGAFGALARLSEQLRPIVEGIESADSIAFDMHKWMYFPFDVACVLVREPSLHRGTFALRADYLGESDRGVLAGGVRFSDRGVDLTRCFRALKVWMSLKAEGVAKFASLIEQNVHQARYLAERIEAEPNLQLLAPVPLNVVNFRYAPPGLSEEALNALNRELVLQVQESGVAVPSSTILKGRFAIRCAIVNHRSRREDFDELVEAVLRFGGRMRGGI